MKIELLMTMGEARALHRAIRAHEDQTIHGLALALHSEIERMNTKPWRAVEESEDLRLRALCPRAPVLWALP